MSQKHKRGLQRGLNEIIAQQTAPAPDKSKLSSGLISKFKETPPPTSIRSDPPRTADPSVVRTPSEKESEPLRNEPVRNTKGLQILPVNSPHLRFAYEVLDHALSKLEPAPRTVLLRLYRLSAGFNTSVCHVSIGKLATHCKLGPTKLRDCLKLLESDGYIRRISVDVSNKNREQRGISFEVFLPRIESPSQREPLRSTTPSATRTPSWREPNKEKALKESYIKDQPQKVTRLTPNELTDFAATVSDLIADGQTSEQITKQFSAGMHPDDWKLICARVEEKGST